MSYGLPKIRLVVTNIWDCGNASRRHKTERVAQFCMEKYEKHVAFNKIKSEKLMRMNARLNDRASRPSGPLGGLSVRSKNLLMSEGYITVEAVRSALDAGLLDKVQCMGPQ